MVFLLQDPQYFFQSAGGCNDHRRIGIRGTICLVVREAPTGCLFHDANPALGVGGWCPGFSGLKAFEISAATVSHAVSGPVRTGGTDTGFLRT